MTATVVLGPTATREEWLAARRLGVTGTDISAILGANPWATPLDIWLDKTGPAREVRENDALRTELVQVAAVAVAILEGL